MAFGSGVLISALSFELMEEAFQEAGLTATATGFLLGAALYAVANRLLTIWGAKHRKRSGTQQPSEEDFSQPTGLVQIGAIGITYLIAWLLARKIYHYFEKGIDKVKTRMRFLILSPAQFTKLLGYLLWLFLIWFTQVIFKEFTIPATLLHMTLNLVIAVLVIRFASFYIKSTFWSRFVYVVCLAFIFLRIFKLWEPTVKLLNSMTIGLGKISISVWGLTEAIIVFIVLWAAAGAGLCFLSANPSGREM